MTRHWLHQPGQPLHFPLLHDTLKWRAHTLSHTLFGRRVQRWCRPPKGSAVGSSPQTPHHCRPPARSRWEQARHRGVHCTLSRRGVQTPTSTTHAPHTSGRTPAGRDFEQCAHPRRTRAPHMPPLWRHPAQTDHTPHGRFCVKAQPCCCACLGPHRAVLSPAPLGCQRASCGCCPQQCHRDPLPNVSAEHSAFLKGKKHQLKGMGG